MSGKFRVITYNIRKGKGANGRSRVEMEALGRALAEHDADLVLCQEVFHCGETGASQSGHLAQVMGLPSYYGANKFRVVGHHGNTTLTRLAVDHCENHDISTNRVERRGALYLRSRIGDRALHVFNVHLGLNGFQRRTQISRVAALLEAVSNNDDAVVLAGDFNDWRHELDPLVIVEHGFRNVFGDHDRQEILTWHSRRPIFNLDRIYVKNLVPSEARRLDGTPWSELSDHLPLLADLHPL